MFFSNICTIKQEIIFTPFVSYKHPVAIYAGVPPQYTSDGLAIDCALVPHVLFPIRFDCNSSHFSAIPCISHKNFVEIRHILCDFSTLRHGIRRILCNFAMCFARDTTWSAQFPI